MRLIFAGTPEFAVAALDALADAGHEICLVLTQPDRPVGRGLRVRPSPVKAAAIKRAIPVFQPVSLRDPEVQARISAAGADALIVAAYGLILPAPVLTAARYGAINIHASLLPRWRGAAPVQRAILAGDRETGVSIMQMDAGLDTGPVWAVERVAIGADETAGTLTQRLSTLGAAMMVATLARLPGSTSGPVQQPTEGITYATKIKKVEAVLDFRTPAVVLERVVRAFAPTPGASTHFRGESIKIWKVTLLNEDAHPQGSIVSAAPSGIDVACGKGLLRITEVQRAGGKRVTAAEFLHGSKLTIGDCFELAPEAAP